jgi:hypothetical protein
MNSLPRFQEAPRKEEDFIRPRRCAAPGPMLDPRRRVRAAPDGPRAAEITRFLFRDLFIDLRRLHVRTELVALALLPSFAAVIALDSGRGFVSASALVGLFLGGLVAAGTDGGLRKLRQSRLGEQISYAPVRALDVACGYLSYAGRWCSVLFLLGFAVLFLIRGAMAHAGTARPPSLATTGLAAAYGTGCALFSVLLTAARYMLAGFRGWRLVLMHGVNAAVVLATYMGAFQASLFVRRIASGDRDPLLLSRGAVALIAGAVILAADAALLMWVYRRPDFERFVLERPGGSRARLAR